MKFMPHPYKILICALAWLTCQNLKALEGFAPLEEFSFIPAGEFTMGKTDKDSGISNATAHKVTLNAYYIGQREVTWSEWDRVIMEGARKHGYSNLFTTNKQDISVGSGSSNYPVYNIKWHHAVQWCNLRSEMEGLTPAYYTNDEQTEIYKTGDVNITNLQVKWSASGYRLPTEAEWEKAARGGLSGKSYPWGDEISREHANYLDGTESETAPSPVGSFELGRNGYELDDMAGNVSEWCWDMTGDPIPDYPTGDRINPRGPLPEGKVTGGKVTGKSRILRGGSHKNEDITCRVAVRLRALSTYTNDDIGFRMARSVTSTSGLVTDQSSSPLDGVSVTAFRKNIDNDFDGSIAQVSTDSEGKYEFLGLDPGAYRFKFRKDGYIEKYYRSSKTVADGEDIIVSDDQANEVDVLILYQQAMSQDIDFPEIQEKIIGNPAFAVTATASSGLPVTIKVKSGPAEISDDMVTLTGAGTVVLAANQPGNADYLPAAEVTRTFVVSKADQNIGAFPSIGNKTFGDPPFDVTPPTIPASGLPVTLSIKSGPATISGTTVTLMGAGTVVLAANQAGDDNYNAAPEVTTSFSVGKATQTIDAFAPIADKILGDLPFAVSPPVAKSLTKTVGLPVSLSVKSGPATISGNIVTLTGVGAVVLAANQSGDANYTAATEVTTSFMVKGPQTIRAFASIGNKTFGDPPFDVPPPTASSDLPVTLTVKSGPATISGNTVTISGAGEVVLAANQEGNANYAAATQVTTSFSVGKATQTIDAFAPIADKILGDPPFAVTPPVTRSQAKTVGLPVSLSVKSGPATISGNTLTPTGPGVITLAANQAGNANYLPALEVTTRFAVLDMPNMTGVYIGNFDHEGSGDIQKQYDGNGQLSLNVSKGTFSGSLVSKGGRVAIKGKFDAQGKASIDFKTKTLNGLSIKLAMEPMNDELLGVLVSMQFPQASPISFNCYPVAYTGKGGEADFPLAGKQINSLLASQSISGIDFGHGFAMIKTSKDGALKFTGRAADGSAITGATRLVKDAFGDILAPVSFPLSAVKGLLHGVAEINSNPGEGQYHFASPFEWTWLRLPQTKAKTYKEGFAEKLGVYGQVWSFTKGQSALPEAEGGFTFQVDPEAVLLEEPLDLSGSWPTSNKPVWDGAPKGFTFKVNTATGQISGSAPRTIDGKATKALKYEGLLVRPALESYDAASLMGGGYLQGTESSGVVELTTP